MPISDNLLTRRTNQHLLVSARMTIGEAFAAFQAVEGKSWDEQVRFWLQSDKLVALIEPSDMLETVEKNSLSDQEVMGISL